ncbi:sodium:solute symporter family protein [Endozoicomonas sp. 4G]|uniref:sodium:solute symporter family protein n=1 Tax=Endozoicomonas sp. 4G TaxID=2872754 RepID=UPI002078C2DE|nr:sodium:solute symporter family protein [Endozoicomonas sp. 4G]
MSLSLWLILAYFLVLVPLSIRAKKASLNDDAEDHYLASRSLGFFVLFLTLYATAFSGNTLVGFTGQAYLNGFHWVLTVGFWAGIVTSFHFLVPKLRPISVQHQFVTPGDWIRFRFQKDRTVLLLRRALAICLCLTLANFLFAQLKAAGEIMATITDEAIPYKSGVVLFALVILLYDSIGGLRAVAWTDVFQGMMMFIGSIFLIVWMIENSGGLTALGDGVSRLRPESMIVPDSSDQLRWLSIMLLGSLSIVVYPQTLQRVFASIDTKTLNKSLAALGVIGLFTNLVVLLVGWCAISLFAHTEIPNVDQVMPMLLEQWAASGSWNAFAAAIVLVAVLAAIMSTADSVLLSLISMLRHDIPEHSERQGLRRDYIIAVVVMGVITLCALNRDITLWRLIVIKLELLVQCFPAFVIALHLPKIRSGAVLCGLITGVVIVFTAITLGMKELWGINIGLIALAANLLVLTLVFMIQSRTSGLPDSETRL